MCKKPVMLCVGVRACVTGCLTVCSDYRSPRAWRRLRGWDGELLPGQGDASACPPLLELATGTKGVRRRGCSLCELPLSLPLCLSHSSVCRSASRSWSVVLQRLQMCTNKGGLKQNESKQTNGIRVMGVGGLVHSDKHNDALYV